MNTMRYIFIVFLFCIFSNSNAQSIANYSVTRSTGISYNSIMSSGTPIGSWRYVGSYSQDDNRSNLTDIGFDFWYNGIRYTQFNVSTNGYIDFSTNAGDGGPTTGAYGYDNTQFSAAGTTPGTGGTLLSVAPMYDDMTTQGGVDPLGNSIKYELTGSAPNRVLTIEWNNMAVYGNTTPSLNFQVKLYETTGAIEFIYGTMIAGTATWSYTSGIVGPTVSGTATAAQLKIQQTVNSATFSNAETHTLSTIPASDSKLTFTPPTPTAASGALTFSGVTSSATTVNWTNWAANEIGYAVYRSEDNVNFIYVTQTAANATSYGNTGLLPGTTYYYKVYAVTEGGVSAAVSGSQATLAPGTITSIATGNWSATTTWSSGTVPTASDNVTIANGHTVTINANANCFNLTVGQGATGILRVGNNATARTLVITGDITINNGARLDINTASDITHQINLSGDIINNGILNLASDVNSLGNITFNKNGNQTISGTGATMNFNLMTVNMGTSINNILEITSSNLTAATGFLTITNGTFKISTTNSVTLTPFSSAATIPSDGQLWLNSSSASLSALGTISLYGILKISSGSLTVGDAANENITSYGGSIEISGGTLDIAGRLDRVNNTAITSFTMSGGVLTLPKIGSTTAALAPFQMDVTGSIFNMSGGTIVIERAGATNLGFLASDGTLNVTNGTLQIGNASTPVGQTIQINSAVSLANITVNSANATAQLANSLTVFNDLTITAGTFSLNNMNFSLGRHWVNSGTFTPGTGTVTFNGSGTQNLTKSGGETFYNLILNKSSGSLISNNDLNVTNSFTQTSGDISLGSNILTLGVSTASVGTLNYTSGKIIGKLKRWINATGTGILFPVGTSSYKREALITFTNLTSGSLTVEFISSNPGNSGLPITDGGFSIANTEPEGYWTFTAANGLISTNYALELNGNGFTTYSIQPSTRLLYRATSGNPWSANGTHVPGSGTTVKRNSLNGLSAQFAFGQTVCSLFGASSITGSTSVCTNASGVSYSVPNTTGNTYTWTITGGTKASGGSTNAITVNWGATGGAGQVQVVERNDCGDNNTAIILPVNINPVATSAITGANSVASSTNGEIYSVINTAGYTYTWLITGGTQASGGTTNSITVNWGAANPTANVRVTTTRLCGGTDVVNLPVVVRAPIVSNASGNWATGGTWVGGVVPTASDYVQIATGHTVTMNSNPGACAGLTINGTANWTAANTTNVGLGGIKIGATGNITGSVAGVLTSTGGLIINSTLTSTSVGILLQTTAGQIISGTGSLAKLTINSTTTNTGTLTVTGTLAGSSTLTNGTNAILNINAPNFTLTGLDGSASGNTISYGASGGQSIKNITYHHLGLSGSGTKTLSGSTTVNGNLTITGVTLDISASNYPLSVGGNWNNSGTFQSRFGTVTFGGSSAQGITKSGGEIFNNINFQGNGTKTLNNNITAIDLAISNGTLSAGSNTISLSGNWSNTGVLNSGTGTVILNGNSLQTVTGGTSFNHLTVNNSAGVNIVSGSQSIAGTLTLTTGTLATNSNTFTLLSNASGTARIDGAGNGTISGSIKMQRYLTGTAGYRYISSPLNGALISELQPEIRLDGMIGSTQPTYWCNLYRFNEASTGPFANGWVAETNVANPLTNGKGFALYIYAATGFPATFDLQGTLTRGSKTLPVTFRNNGDADQGWNLVGNPYPSSIDWDAASGWTRTNIQGNTYYAWDNATQQYAIYPAGGPGINGGTRYIVERPGKVSTSDRLKVSS